MCHLWTLVEPATKVRLEPILLKNSDNGKIGRFSLPYAGIERRVNQHTVYGIAACRVFQQNKPRPTTINRAKFSFEAFLPDMDDRKHRPDWR
jgi:hypothetical protein